MKSVALSLMCGGAWATGGEEHAAMIEKIQNTPGVLWRAGINEKFGKESVGTIMKPLMGVKKEAMAERLAFAVQNGNSNLTSTYLPENFDSEEQWPHCAKVIGEIRDQSDCGCCWAFAAVSAASDRLCISTHAKELVSLSAQDMCFCSSSDGCNGGDITSPWIYINWNHHWSGKGVVTGGQYKGTGPFGYGFCSDFSLPHCHHHGPQRDDPYPPEGSTGCPSATSPQCPTSCGREAAAPNNVFLNDKFGFSGHILRVSGEHPIAAAIAEGGPVETAFDVYADFANYVGGIYHHVTGDFMGGHAVRFVGWGVENGQKYWKVANSWNPYWGEHGYFRIKKGNNECSIEDMVTASNADATWSKKSCSELA